MPQRNACIRTFQIDKPAETPPSRLPCVSLLIIYAYAPATPNYTYTDTIRYHKALNGGTLGGLGLGNFKSHTMRADPHPQHDKPLQVPMKINELYLQLALPSRGIETIISPQPV